MDYEHVFAQAARGVEVVGVSLLLLGAILAGGVFARRLVRGGGFHAAYHAFRGDLGRAILLALELLVVADIIGTVATTPTLDDLAVLAAIVAIRTFLSFYPRAGRERALALAAAARSREGRWPCGVTGICCAD